MSDLMIPVLQDFLSTLVTGVLGVLSAFCIALVKRGFDWLAEKIDSLKDDRAQKALNNALTHLHEIVDATVKSLQQTIGDEIKASLAANDGKYTREDLYALKDKALVSVNAQMTNAMKEALSTAYSDLDSFIVDLIETKVREMKNDLLPVGTFAKVLLG